MLLLVSMVIQVIVNQIKLTISSQDNMRIIDKLVQDKIFSCVWDEFVLLRFGRFFLFFGGFFFIRVGFIIGWLVLWRSRSGLFEVRRFWRVFCSIRDFERFWRLRYCGVVRLGLLFVRDSSVVEDELVKFFIFYPLFSATIS